MIDKKDVEYAAGLAQLKLDEEEKEKYTEQIGEILNYVDKLSELDTDDVVPTAYTAVSYTHLTLPTKRIV